MTWSDIFHLFVGQKKRKPVMEDNFRLNINIEGYIANLHCLFQYFKHLAFSTYSYFTK